MTIHEMLGSGLNNAINGRDLANALGVPIRVIVSMVEQERRQGWLICADSKRGYFLPVNEQEADRYLMNLTKRTKELTITRLAMMRNMEEHGWLAKTVI